MKRLLTFTLALLALCDLANGQAVNTLSISNSVPNTNFFIISVGNRLVRVASSNVFAQIAPATARLGALTLSDVFYASNNAAFLADVTVSGGLDVADITASGTVTAVGFTLTGTNGGADTFTATNSRGVVNRVAKDPSVWVTNVIGLTHIAQASVMTANANDGQRWTITNRLAQNSTLVWTNAAEGQRLHLTLRGAASGGSDYYLTNVFPTGFLVLDSNSTNTAAALSRVLFIQDGTKAELDIVVDRFAGTNFANVAVSQPVQ